MAEEIKDQRKSELTADEKELKQLELEEKRLEVAFKKANLQDMDERLKERELKREDRRQKSIINGQTLRALEEGTKQAQARCNHHKGGDGAEGVIGGRGNSPQYSIMVHKFANGDVWIRCLRCGKTWKPPVKSQHKTDESYNKAMTEYRAALEFPTQNKPSAGVVFGFSDGGEFYREVTKNATLR